MDIIKPTNKHLSQYSCTHMRLSKYSCTIFVQLYLDMSLLSTAVPKYDYISAAVLRSVEKYVQLYSSKYICEMMCEPDD